MILSDYHLHTDFSGDSKASVDSMIERAISLGLDRICITDHMDLEYPCMPDYFEFDPKVYCNRMKEAKEKYSGQIKVLTGVELGLRNEPDIKERMKTLYQTLTSQYEFDFIIGSTHVVEGYDPYYPEYWDHNTVKPGLQSYFQSIIDNVKQYDCFNVYGHLDYIIRYIPEGEKDYQYSDYKDLLEEVLRTIISHGKGIELNTAGWKYGLATAHPKPEVLKRYRELGGELITVGSDAHEPKHVAYDFQRAEQVLKECGFRYMTVYEGQKPIFIEL